MANGVGSDSSQKIKWKELTTFQKFYEIFKWTGAVAALALAGYSKCEAEIANRKAAQAPKEIVTKAAIDELSKKINDLAHDVEAKEKAFLKSMRRAVSKFDKRAASAESKAESVRSLFIGHALASRTAVRPSVKRDLENLTKSINDAAKQTKSTSGKSPFKIDKAPKRFKPTRKYDDIKQQKRRETPTGVF